MAKNVKVPGLLNRPFRVSVEGNIGAGKSTLINYFKKIPGIETYDEPLEKWRNCQGHNLFGLLYEDIKGWNATFQSYVQLTRTQLQLTNVEPEKGTYLQLFERSVQNNRFVFMENSYQSGLLSPPDYAVLCEWYNWIEDAHDISLDLIVYLRSSPDVVYKRILSRNRVEEKAITKEYLINLHDAHEKWLNNPNLKIPVCVIDANSTLNEIQKSYDTILPKIFETQGKPLNVTV